MKTLKEAREHLKENLDNGLVCPCCDKWAQRYKYAFNSSMARTLIFVFQEYKSGRVEKDEFFHIDEAITRSGHCFSRTQGNLQKWGLMEQMPNDDETKRTSGFWRITKKGRNFVRGKVTIPKYAYLYNNSCEGFDGDKIDIEAALGTKFDYSKLMKGKWD